MNDGFVLPDAGRIGLRRMDPAFMRLVRKRARRLAVVASPRKRVETIDAPPPLVRLARGRSSV